MCVSGHVNKPGVFELPMGITFNQIINDVCGGVWKGRKVKAVIPGGVSMPPLDADELDVPCEFDALQTDERIKPVMVRPGQQFDLGGGRTLRTMAGSGGVVVMDDATDIPKARVADHEVLRARVVRPVHAVPRGHRLAREGLRAASPTATASPTTSSCSSSIAHGIAGNTICALGDAAAWPMLGFLTKFRSDFEAKIRKQARDAPSDPDHVGLRGGDRLDRRGRPIPAQVVNVRPAANVAKRSPHSDRIESTDKGMALLFWMFAAASVGGALFVITRRNLIAAVMGMVGSFLGIAAVYMMLYAQLPRGRADARVRRRDHGAVRLRHHDPEPARGRAGRAVGADRPGARRRSRSSTWSAGS